MPASMMQRPLAVVDSALRRGTSPLAGFAVGVKFVSTSLRQSTGRAAAILLGGLFLAACNSSGGGLFGAGPKPAPVALVETDQPADAKPLVHPVSNSSIPVLVNDVPITAYDISQRVKLSRLGGGKATQQGAMEELIDETLEMIEAQRRGYTVPEGQVDGAYASIAQRLKLSPDGLTKALGTQGIDGSSLKKRLRAQIAWQALVQRRTTQKAAVKSEEVTAAIASKGDPSTLKITEYTLQQIIFVVPSGSSAGLLQQRRREAEAFRQRFAGCDQSLAQAKLLRGVVVKDIGRRDSTQLNDPQGEKVMATAVGKTAPPNQTDQGVELIAVCATRDIQSTSAARAEAENDLYLKQAADLGKDYLKELRDRAIISYR
jgi:peptidyl-prolyl cis-trans isomerase SurA